VNPKHQADDPETATNSPPEIRVRVAQRRVAWMGPLLVVTGRSALMLLAQALVAAIFFLRGSSAPWIEGIEQS
jgi:hypothetical protein